MLSLIEARVNSRPGADVLDLGFGTGMLTARLYAACLLYTSVWGIGYKIEK